LRSATCERGKLRKVEGTRRSFRSLTDDLEVSIQPHCETLARVFCRESVRESEESSKKQKSELNTGVEGVCEDTTGGGRRSVLARKVCAAE